MKEFPADVRFRGVWREYQARVLSEIDEHLRDRSLHVVAAPGAGKTVLGLEIVRRLNRPALVLAPTLAVRDQWIDRFRGLFLPPDSSDPEWISRDLKAPAFLTVTTYQALHAGASSGSEETDSDETDSGDDSSDAEAAPSARALEGLLKLPLGVLVLDEAHHLRAAWWRTLTQLKASLHDPAVVALTATPPYDVPPEEWDRYHALCGPVDAQVSVPELVKAGSLCPHQDFVFYCPPAESERETIEKARAAARDVQQRLEEDKDFRQAIRTHPWMAEPGKHVDEILERPACASAMLVYLGQTLEPLPPYAMHLLGAADAALPALDARWTETLLNELVLGEAGRFPRDMVKELTGRLQRSGLLFRGKAVLSAPEKLEKLLSSSLSKLDAVERIVREEREARGERLRLVVLADRIGQAELPKAAWDRRPLLRVGAVPVFERLRREGTHRHLGLLTGSIVIVPAEAARLAAQDSFPRGAALKVEPFPADDAYVMLSIESGEPSLLVPLVTRLFTEGFVQTLVGTKSLLGEGWDAPCVNALVVLSGAGGSVSINQMRGRALRRDPREPEKTSSLWHLACVEPGAADGGREVEALGRRFRSFVGLSWKGDVVEGGLSRLGLPRPPLPGDVLEAHNRQAAARAADHGFWSGAWKEALVKSSGAIVEQVRSKRRLVRPGALWRPVLKDASRRMVAFAGAGGFLAGCLYPVWNPGWAAHPQMWVAASVAVGAASALPVAARLMWMLAAHSSLRRSHRRVARALLEALRNAGLVGPLPASAITSETRPDGQVTVWLKDAKTYDQSIFSDAFHELMGPLRNPRYLLCVGRDGVAEAWPVPESLGAKKETAILFEAAWRRWVCPARLTYARTPQGRKTLLRARARQYLSPAQEPDRLDVWR